MARQSAFAQDMQLIKKIAKPIWLAAIKEIADENKISMISGLKLANSRGWTFGTFCSLVADEMKSAGGLN